MAELVINNTKAVLTCQQLAVKVLFKGKTLDQIFAMIYQGDQFNYSYLDVIDWKEVARLSSPKEIERLFNTHRLIIRPRLCWNTALAFHFAPSDIPYHCGGHGSPYLVRNAYRFLLLSRASWFGVKWHLDNFKVRLGEVTYLGNSKPTVDERALLAKNNIYVFPSLMAGYFLQEESVWNKYSKVPDYALLCHVHGERSPRFVLCGPLDYILDKFSYDHIYAEQIPSVEEDSHSDLIDQMEFSEFKEIFVRDGQITKKMVEESGDCKESQTYFLCRLKELYPTV